MRLRSAVLAAVFLAASQAATGWGCSLADGSLMPTNYELVRETDTIVLARAESEVAPSKERDAFPQFRFTIVDTLRGKYPEKTIDLPAGARFAGASPEDDFSSARPGAFVGSCVAFDYRPSHLYVIFLENRKGVWGLHHVPFSRVNEEVRSTGSPWVLAVRTYSTIADLGAYDREKAALSALAKRASAPLATDIAKHFATATYAKSEADLVEMYSRASDEEDRRRILWALGQFSGAQTSAIFHGWLSADRLPDRLESPVCRWVERQHQTGELANVLRHAAARATDRHWAFLRPIAELGGATEIEPVNKLLPSLSDGEIAFLAQEAGWLSGTAAVMKELRRRVGTDIAEKSDLTLVLAAWGDTPTVQWALQSLGRTADSGELSWIGPYVLARSPLPEAREGIQRILASKNPALVSSLIDGLAEAKRAEKLDLIRAALAALPGNPEVLTASRRALSNLAEDNDSGAAALLATLPPEAPENPEP